MVTEVPVPVSYADIIDDIVKERKYQDSIFHKEFDNKNTANDWNTLITHYAAPPCRSCTVPDTVAPPFDEKKHFEKMMLKVATLAVAAIQATQRNNGPAPRHYD